MRALSFDDIQLVPRFNNIPSRKDVSTRVQFGDLTLDVPIFSSNMDTITDSKMARTMYKLGGLGFLHRFCSIEENISMYDYATKEWQNTREPRKIEAEAVVSLGVNEGLDRFHALYEIGARYFCIDVAHGHSESVGRMIKSLKKFSDDIYVVAGNVCTRMGAEYLAGCGADAIKIGVGPGSACTTRIKTGFGIPQFTAIRECSRVNVFKIADGGIRTPGDAVKAFAAGADAIMLGGMLAGCDETPGELITDIAQDFRGDWKATNDSYKIFRGMASKEAQDDFMGSMSDWKAAEGVEITVKVKGPASNVVNELMGGIRSGMTYCGANNIREIRERAEWVEISPAGAAEAKPHGEGRL
jgi:IMP dehydrogenase